MSYSALIFILAFASVIVGLSYFTSRYNRRSSLALRLEGIRTCRLIKQLLTDLQQHRGLVNVLLSGDNTFKPRIEQKQAALQQDISALDAVSGQGLITERRWQAIRSDWQSLSKDALSLPAEVSFKRHSELIRAALDTMGDVAERSQIAGVCAADPALVNALWSKLPAVAEGLGLARGVGSSVAAKGHCCSVSRIKLRFLKEHVSETMVRVNSELEHADIAQSAAFNQAWRDTHLAVQQFLTLLDEKLINVDRPAIDAEQYFSAGTRAMDAVFNAFDQASLALESSLN